MTVSALILSVVFRTFFTQLNPVNQPNTTAPPNIRGDTENELWHIMENLNESLKKYGIDSSACMNRIMCTYVKNSVRAKRSRKKVSHFNKILEGLSRSDWAMEYVAGTEVESAVRVARSDEKCESFYSKCRPGAWFLKN